MYKNSFVPGAASVKTLYKLMWGVGQIETLLFLGIEMGVADKGGERKVDTDSERERDRERETER